MRDALSIIIVEYEDPTGTDKMIRSLVGDLQPAIQVVSTGLRAYEAPADVTGVYVLHLPSNPGFGAAVNAGVAGLPAGVSYALICNTDVDVTPGLVWGLLEEAREAPEYGIISPVLISEHRAVEWDGGEIDFAGVKISHRRFGKTIVSRGGLEVTRFVTCACALVSREAWLQVGGMREDFFLYGEDADYSLRLTSAGYRCGIAPGYLVVHQRSRSVGWLSYLQLYLMTRNSIRLFQEWSPHTWGRVASWIVFPMRSAWRSLQHGCDLNALRWVLRGCWDARRHSVHNQGQGRASVLLK